MSLRESFEGVFLRGEGFLGWYFTLLCIVFSAVHTFHVFVVKALWNAL